MDYEPPPLCLTPFTFHKKNTDNPSTNIYKKVHKTDRTILGSCDPKRQPNLYPNEF